MLVPQNYQSLPTKKEKLPDGSTYERFDPPPPDHTYEINEIAYDLVSKKWKTPFAWKKPHMTWKILKQARNFILRDSDFTFKNKILTQEQIDALEIYRQKLRDIPSVFEGVDPWKVSFPDLPEELKENNDG
jgi:hypothetical protein